MNTATSLTSWARIIRSAVEAAGLDSRPLFAAANLDMAKLGDSNARYPLAGTTRLWQLAREATGEEAIGLLAARHVTPSTFHALGYSQLASTTLKEAFERMLRYFRMVTDAGDLQFDALSEYYRLELRIDPTDPQPAAEAVDAMAAVIIGMCRTLYGKSFAPLAVSLCRPRPSNPALYEQVLCAPVRFAAERNEILIANTVMHEPLDSANAEVARHNEEVIARYLAHFEKENIINRVHATLVTLLPNGEPSKEAVAEALHMSVRNFQRKLGAEGQTWKDLLNRTRSDLAQSYLRDSKYSISEVAFLLGFSDASSFTRAFRRWVGHSPKEWRAKADITGD